jgi:hypothetical protein
MKSGEAAMPEARRWTAAADSTICGLRAAGATWAEIGRQLGLSRNTVIERGRRLCAMAPPRAAPIVRQAEDDPSRGALPAGHPLTWGLLTAEPYPLEVGRIGEGRRP